MATLKDVAKLACVDVSTVSRALNNTSYVHPETKERIYAAAKELGYRPNAVAKALRQGRSNTIGVVIPRLHLAIFSEMLQGLEEEAMRRGFFTVVSVTEDDPAVEKQCLEKLRSSTVDGIIIAATGRNNRLLRDIKAGGISVIQLVRRQEPRMSSVVADYEACGYEAVKYLFAKGCREIGIIDGSEWLAPYRDRREWYRKAIESLGLEPNYSSCADHAVNTFDYGYECAGQLLDDNPDLDAIIASVDIQGLGAIRAIKEAGKKIPDDVRVISLTGHAVGGMLQTTMTSMEIPAQEMGRRAAQILIDDIEAPENKKPGVSHLTLAASLVEREST